MVLTAARMVGVKGPDCLLLQLLKKANVFVDLIWYLRCPSPIKHCA